METTENKLIEDMVALGYSIKKRTLTDWRAKELLPRLKPRGHGRGRGKEYYWDEPGILAQAVGVFELLETYRRVEDVYLPLWLIGHSVSLDIVREKMLVWYGDYVKRFNELDADSREGIADKMALNALRWTNSPSADRQAKHILMAVSTLIEFLTKAFFTVDYEPTDDDIEDVVSGLKQIAPYVGKFLDMSKTDEFIIQNPEGVRAWFPFIRQYCNPPVVMRYLTESSDAVWQTVHRDLRVLIYFLDSMCDVLGAEEFRSQVYYKMLPNLSQFLVILDLGLRFNKQFEFLDNAVLGLLDIARRIANDAQFRRKLESAKAKQVIES
jgi:hypothetical protein